MNSEQATNLTDLLESILMKDRKCNYKHRQTYEYGIVIEFDPKPEEDEEESSDEEEYEPYYKRSMNRTYIKIHLIMFKTLEIVTYQMKLKSSSDVFKNLKYNSQLTCIKCNGSKCREKNSKVFCESCYDPDDLNYWELVLIKNKTSKIEVNNTLFIYNLEYFTQIFDGLLYYFTSEQNSSRTYGNYLLSNYPKNIPISERKKLQLIQTMYSGIKKYYCETEQKEFKVGPHPNELPIPKNFIVQ